MDKFVFVLYRRDNKTQRVTHALYSSRTKAIKEYNNIKDNLLGYWTGSKSQESQDTKHLNIQYGDELLKHCFIGGSETPEHDSIYIVRKYLN